MLVSALWLLLQLPVYEGFRCPPHTALDYLVRLYFELIIDRNDAKALKRIGEGKKELV